MSTEVKPASSSIGSGQRPRLHIRIRHEPPSHGWLPIHLSLNGQDVLIVASDVPNNPIQELLEALESAAHGRYASVWWHLEPDGYFMRFVPIGDEIKLLLEFAPGSIARRAEEVLCLQGTRVEVLLSFWRFVRDFQSRSYSEMDWPSVDYSRIRLIREAIGLPHQV